MNFLLNKNNIHTKKENLCLSGKQISEKLYFFNISKKKNFDTALRFLSKLQKKINSFSQTL